jgi:ABC-2 type transport system ATP-binding protein
MPDAISFNAVTKIYRIPSILPWQAAKKIEALNNASFACPRGGISCLLGPNGAGKTTIIKILAGLVAHDGGSIRLSGMPYDDTVRHGAVKIGVMASNDRSFYWRLTGRQNLVFFSSLYGFSGAKVRRVVSDILAELGLEAEADKPFRLYSSGTKQKFLLARALLSGPDILLLDEPTSHIDPIAKDAIHSLILDNFIGKRKTTILLCTHDLYEVERLADYIILLDGGKVISEGSPDRIRSMIAPGVTFVMEFSRMPGKQWSRGLPVVIVSEKRGRIECTARNKTGISAAIEAVVAAGGKVTRCVELDESIIDIFSRLAGGAS